MNGRKILAGISVVVVVIVAAIGIFYGVYVQPFMSSMKNVETVPYDQNLTLFIGGGGNSGVLTSDSVVLVIDTKMDEAAKALYDAVKRVADKKPIIVINTHIHTDHTQGNTYYTGQTIIAGGNYDPAFWAKENKNSPLPTVWVKDSLIFKVGDETVTVLNLGFSAHTQSDVVVYLSNRKMIFTGDVVLNRSAPAMFKNYNASSNGYLAAFDLMEKRFDIKKVIPGHGEPGGPEVIDDYRTFFADMRVAALDAEKKDALIAKYKTWKQIPFLMSPAATVSYIKGEHSK